PASYRVVRTKSYLFNKAPVHQKQKLTDAGLKLMATAKMPDALRLSGLRHLCNILNFRAFVGRIRRSRRIRHE
ncbi:hypothetical protein, partial [Escherichia coli]|uniref:hypothetical protein n=1 Tax=Escherichia coli TaxID=562 RepID=UPI0039BF8212